MAKQDTDTLRNRPLYFKIVDWTINDGRESQQQFCVAGTDIDLMSYVIAFAKARGTKLDKARIYVYRSKAEWEKAHRKFLREVRHWDGK